MEYVVDFLVKLLRTPSPSGYTDEASALVEREFAALGVPYTRTNKGILVATLKGHDDENHRLLAGHIDALGAMVKEIKPSGRLRYAPVGGGWASAVEGEYCTIISEGNKRFTGTILTTKAAAHVYGKDGEDLPRKHENMEIRIDQKVRNAAETRALGIEVGDFVAYDTRTEVTPAGFVKSRHLDDKASVTAMLGALRTMVRHGLAPAATTHFLISNFEEVGHGGAHGTPPKTKEFIAVDMGCVGEGIQATEYDVSICARDSSGPYDLELRRRLVALCREHAIPHAVDIYPFYGSDASAALRAGHDVRAIVIGPGVDASHAFERTHREGIRATADLLVAYMLA
jgi:putative aminopeptidase FrvX